MSAHQLIRKQAAQHDLFNRLQSIAADQAFVQRVRTVWFDERFVVVGKSRCGIWYCDPSTTSSAYAYFKSTDGHTSIWNFSLRRSNLPFASYAEDQGGVILVDATRRGKRMPDALSKTVPIWCTVINRAIALRQQGTARDMSEWDEELYLPPQIVSASERAQIEARINDWAKELEASALPLPNLCRPLRPFFLHPGTTVPPSIPERDICPFTPIICLSASRWQGKDSDQSYVIGRSLGDAFEYIMGSGDDEELWGRGLTSSLYHRHTAELLAASRDDLPSIVDELVERAKLPNAPISTETQNVTIEAHGVPSANSPIGIALPVASGSQWSTSTSSLPPLILTIVPCKVPPRALFTTSNPTIALSNAKTHGTEFSQALELVHRLARAALASSQRIAIRCGVPGDFEKLQSSVESDNVAMPFQGDIEAFEKAAREGVIFVGIVLLMLGVDNEGVARQVPSSTKPTKKELETRLHWLMSIWPSANVARSGLKRVNELLMSNRTNT